MYKLPLIGSPIAGAAPTMKELTYLEPPEDDKLPFEYNPNSGLGSQFPISANPPTPTKQEAVQKRVSGDYGTEGGPSVADLFRMNQQPYTRDNIYDLTNTLLNSRSPYNPSGKESPLDPVHYVNPPSERHRNYFFDKPFDQMTPREQVDFHAYHPDIKNFAKGMNPREEKAYRKARYGYDNSAYFKTGPEDKRSFEDMVANYKPLDQRVAERKGV